MPRRAVLFRLTSRWGYPAAAEPPHNLLLNASRMRAIRGVRWMKRWGGASGGAAGGANSQQAGRAFPAPSTISSVPHGWAILRGTGRELPSSRDPLPSALIGWDFSLGQERDQTLTGIDIISSLVYVHSLSLVALPLRTGRTEGRTQLLCLTRPPRPTFGRAAPKANKERTSRPPTWTCFTNSVEYRKLST